MKIWIALLWCVGALAQTPAPVVAVPRPERDFRSDEVLRNIDIVNWRLGMADAAEVDDVQYTSLPVAKPANPTGQGALNPLIIHALTFIPKGLDRSRQHPLIVFVHGGVHSRFDSESMHIVRELIGQGYSIIAPDYRGSTGYGSDFYNSIDYGGREVDDVHAAREWMLQAYKFLDPKRVGIIGWSHGGMISLLSIFQQPKAYAVAYAGVPVSDLVARMGYKSESYRQIFSARGHFGKSAADDVEEYLRRSPVTYAAQLATPLLIHTNTNDEDVNVLEVRRMIAALKAEGKQFEYKIYENAPGGHHFNRIDTALAKESRAEVWKFLARYLLKP